MRSNSLKLSLFAGFLLSFPASSAFSSDIRVLAENERSFPNGNSIHYRLQVENAEDETLRLWAVIRSVRSGSAFENVSRDFRVPNTVCDDLGQVRFPLEINAESQPMDKIAKTILNDLSLLCEDESLNSGRLIVGRKYLYPPHDWRPATAFVRPDKLPYSKFEAEYEASEG